MTNMPSTTFTTRIDTDLKSRLMRVAKHEKRSASYLAGEAIRQVVEEHEATLQLVQTGLELIESGAGELDDAEVSAWLLADDDVEFPTAKVAKT